MQSNGSSDDVHMGLQFVESSELQRDTQTYPVLTLPPEIVSEIFLNYLPAYPDCPPLLGTDSPVLLSQICQHWRQISLSTPVLWRAISVKMPRDDKKVVTARIELIQAWLSRSGGLPLSLCLRSFLGSPHLQQFFQAVVFHCERWEYLDMNVHFEHLHLIQGNMPLLRKLTFGASGFRNGDERTAIIFDRAPQLKNVVLMADFYTGPIHLPWAQLTHLDARLYVFECTEILRDAEHLVNLELSVFRNFSGRRMFPIVHPTLRDLKFRGDSDGELGELLDHLTLPALRTLRFYEACIALDTLKAFISRSHCALEELCVDRATLSEMTYREALPSVRTITLIPRDE